ncbi:HEPN domain-containing protein [Aurantimonas coralicida]|uniref:ApeA N-terminal domain 1-containing protein n=1 Tax=Aurantimonas coralicida TaxID=182270 RepID=UPI001E50F0D2|nr:HEPN domain-containing protein [Aurantimonas coralicida]MCD1642884.1 hypothetical protein [Aurantimonas coralicida]
MTDYSDYNSVFHPKDEKISGHLKISGNRSLVNIFRKGDSGSREPDYTSIHGFLDNGAKASLLYCTPRSRKTHHSNEGINFESVLFPNYVVVGQKFIKANEPVIRAVRYHFENVASLLSGRKTFRSLSLSPEEARKLLEKDHAQAARIANTYGWPEPLLESEIGEHPRILYWSGVPEIVAFDAEVGRISLINRTSYGMASAAGIGFDNEVVTNIKFAEPKTLRAATRTISTLHSLFELILGRRQRYQWIEIELTHCDDVDGQSHYQTAQLYWNLCNERANDDPNTRTLDALLNPDRRATEFANVAAEWMNSTEAMGDARERFATAFFAPYSINRIVGAANMFDLLPEDRAPKKKDADEDTTTAVKLCRDVFKDLPDSFAKQSVLSTLGRIGTASLRDKLYHRAEKVITMLGGEFRELSIPCNHAVLARNHYVHGSPASFNYQDNFAEFAFLTDTLEFVFAASDLIEIGWDVREWLSGPNTLEHPFSLYIFEYPVLLERLKRLVRK